MENDRQWKIRNLRNEALLLSGWGLETWNVTSLSAAQISNLACGSKQVLKSPWDLFSLLIT